MTKTAARIAISIVGQEVKEFVARRRLTASISAKDATFIASKNLDSHFEDRNISILLLRSHTKMVDGRKIPSVASNAPW